MNILVTLDRRYLPPLSAMLTSLFFSNPGESFDIYVISDDLSDDLLARERALCTRFGARLFLLRVPPNWFDGAPTLRYYSRAMYYRLLAANLLPKTLTRILYLDPDTLIINPLRALYETDMGANLYAAAMHKGLVNLSGPVNKLRLSTPDAQRYFNSGMLLMNLPAIREAVRAEEIFAYVEKNKALLVLPDQDVLNALYGARILPVDERLWNYDARKYREYKLASQGEWTLERVMENTAVLHFCGKRKPWHSGYRGRFAALYRHYMRLSQMNIIQIP